MNPWLFPDSPETTALTLRSILEEGRSVKFVEHDENGGWHFFDGRSTFSGPELIFARLGKLVELDPSLAEVSDLPSGWRAWRAEVGCPWTRESRDREVTRARAGEALARMQSTTTTPPPDFPGTTEILREDR